MKRFVFGAAAYALACLIISAAIVIRGDGPHPRVTQIYPPNGDEYWPGGAAQVTFSQAMDQASVERALQVSPGTQGQGAWYGTTLNFQPVGDWKPNVTYHVMLTGSVTDELGRPLHTPVSFWFRVHHVEQVAFCSIRGVRNVCERRGSWLRPLTGPALGHGPYNSQPVLQYALSPDASTVAYTRRDASRLPHLFITQVDGTGTVQLTGGAHYADSSPWWTPGDNSSVTYYRRPVLQPGAHPRLGKLQMWNVQTDGSANAAL